jgi:hypothetical protein
MNEKYSKIIIIETERKLIVRIRKSHFKFLKEWRYDYGEETNNVNISMPGKQCQISNGKPYNFKCPPAALVLVHIIIASACSRAIKNYDPRTMRGGEWCAALKISGGA